MIKIVAGKYRSRSIEVPSFLQVPTKSIVRTAIANALNGDLPSAQVLDLFAGSGALGIEALSRGASHCVFVDCISDATSTIERNLSVLHETHGEVFCLNALEALEKFGLEKRIFDLVFLDPPYKEKELYAQCVKTLLDEGLLSSRGVIVNEYEGELVLPQTGFSFAKTYNYGRTNVLILRR